MRTFYENPAGEVPKAPTGIKGFDQITRGGLPRGSVTLVTGGSGSGKTVFALQTLVNGAARFDEPGLFITFEENSRKLLANAASFGWSLDGLKDQKLFFLDATPITETITIGEFDLSGMLAMLEAKAQALEIRRIVFDSLDVLLHLLPDILTRRREINRLHSWLLSHELTAVITAKLDWLQNAMPPNDGALQYLPFIVDCIVALTHEVESGFSQRRVRIIKYRGSSFSEDETPFSIGHGGFKVATSDRPVEVLPLSTEKLSTGITQLDEMLYGGLIRGTTTMITGDPGTAKTTLAGAFAEASSKRGDRTVYIAFDETSQEIVRNLASVNVRLQVHIDSGLLIMLNEYVGASCAEEHFQNIRKLVESHQANCLVIDPFTAFSNAGSLKSTQAVAARLVRWVKSEGITLVCTSLPTQGETGLSGTDLKITTVADTWIYLNFFDGGERNRGLTIVKSRGTNHSNQVRELILASSGISIAPPYTADGTVLMGTMRWQKERSEAEARARLNIEYERRYSAIAGELAELESSVLTLQRNIVTKRAALDSISSAEGRRQEDETSREFEMVRLRQSGEPENSKAARLGPTRKPADDQSSP
jgi:circadian clock protein KaiC